MGCLFSKKANKEAEKNKQRGRKASSSPLTEMQEKKKVVEEKVKREKILLITDPGRDIDDTVALQIIAGSMKEIELVGIVASGGRTKERAKLARAWCNLMKMDPTIPIACCSEQKGSGGVWMPAEFRMLREKELHIGPMSGDELIIDCAKKFKGELIIVAIAPLTPLAHALSKDAEAIKSGVKALYFQGQATYTHDSPTLVPNGEAFNVREDLASAKIVFEQLQDVIPFTLLGKHAAYQVGLDKKDFTLHSMESQVKEILTAFRRSDRSHFNRVYPIPKEKDTEEGWYDALTIVSHPYDPLLLLHLIRPRLFEPQFIGVASSASSTSTTRPPISSTSTSTSTSNLSFTAQTSSASELHTEPGSMSNLFPFRHTLIGNTAEFHGIPDSAAVRTLLIDRMNTGLLFITPKTDS